MKLTNLEAEKYLEALKGENSFTHNLSVKMPPKVRYAVRRNVDKLESVAKAYVDARIGIFNAALEAGKADKDGEDKITIKPAFVPEVVKELTELGNIENDVNLHLVDAAVMDAFLEVTDLALAEEDVLLKFREEEKDG